MSRGDHLGGVLVAMLIGWLVGLATPAIITHAAEAWLR
jgi:hypothetical protein